MKKKNCGSTYGNAHNSLETDTQQDEPRSYTEPPHLEGIRKSMMVKDVADPNKRQTQDVQYPECVQVARAATGDVDEVGGRGVLVHARCCETR